ncbi:hypothetical protein WA1_19100 [Scytonema hofmannii PCC 7110]|uniref:Uncharacterized protein n=1 Tax=Scytonema hofmannii PCC 7110 TaxID=128403 RepID=A0A139XBP2_9CYAN|nr:hypothetical protein [Scytonema hofmannii]KYC42109.1 hypothetical protein WA1_19100 [Scytonema hofmannii PCC 7110]
MPYTQLTSQFWTRWAKPWNSTQCRRRYVEGGDKIGIRQLAKDSGVPKGTLEKWCRDEDWVTKRGQFQDSVETTVREKTVEKVSEKLSDELADIAIANYQSHKKVRDYVNKLFDLKIMSLTVDLLNENLTTEQGLEMMKKHRADEINLLSLALARATQEIAAATGLEYHISLKSATKKLSSEGFQVIDPSTTPDSSDSIIILESKDED